MMELGVGTFTYGWTFDAGEKFDERWLADVATSLGVSVVQVGDNLPLHTFSAGRLQDLRSLLASRNIKVEVGARRLCGEHLSKYIALCRQLGAGMLRFVTDQGDYEPTIGELRTLIGRYVNELESSGVTLAIENHDRLRAAELADLVSGLGSERVGICLDTANSIGAWEQTPYVVEMLAPYTVNLHIKDYGVRRLEHKQGFAIEGRIAGQGRLDIPAIVRLVNSYGRCNSCILEQWVPREADISLTLHKEQEWAMRGIEYLRTIRW